MKASEHIDGARSHEHDEQQLQTVLRSLPANGLRTKKSYEDAIFVKVLLDTQHSGGLQVAAAGGEPQGQLARDYATLVKLIEDFESAQLEYQAAQGLSPAGGSTAPASAGSSAAPSTAPASAGSSGDDEMRALLKERTRLWQQRHRQRDNEAKMTEVNAQLARVADQIIALRARRRGVLLPRHQDQADRAAQTFATAQQHLTASFQAMAALHQEMMREVEMDGELEMHG